MTKIETTIRRLNFLQLCIWSMAKIPFVSYLLCTPSKVNAAFHEGRRTAHVGAAMMCDMSKDQIIIGYHDVKNKRELMDDLHKHFLSCCSTDDKMRRSFYSGSNFPWRKFP